MLRSRALPGLYAAAVCVLYGLPVRADAMRDAVEAGNRAFVAAFLRGDARAVSELYTEDAQVFAPGAPVAKGRAAIGAAWQQSIDAGFEDVVMTTVDVERSGDLAVETGTVRLVAKDGKASEARYVVVWKRTGDVWKMHRDIWNAGL